MEKNEELFRQISDSLAGHFEGVTDMFFCVI